jgi:hypothetical protein
MGLQSFVGKIFGAGIKETAEGVTSLAVGLRTAITGVDPAQAGELKKLLVQAEQIRDKAQAEANKIEAGHKSLFVAGWRPFIGWVCGSALAFNYIFNPIFMWLANIFAENPAALKPPFLDMAELYPLIVGMLGLGIARSAEKIKKSEGNR